MTPVLYAIYFHGEDDFEDASGEEGDYPGSRMKAAKVRELSGKAPTEKEMEVPPNLGAKLDVENSAGMSREDYLIWIYMTYGPVQTVAAFYEKTTKNNAVSVESGSFIISLVGQVPMREHFAMIQDNTMSPSGYKTVITIMRKR